MSIWRQVVIAFV